MQSISIRIFPSCYLIIIQVIDVFFLCISGEMKDPVVGGLARRRRARTMFDDQAVKKLESMFTKDQYPDIVTREELAEQLQVPEARIQVSQRLLYSL